MDIYRKIQAFFKDVKTEKAVIGKSVFNRKIFAVKIGQGSPVGLAQYAIHGREFITAELALKHYEKGVYKGSLWLIPLSNPDGALLSEVGLESAGRFIRKKLIALNGGSKDFSFWKANGRGVDLNVNFDAEWGKGAKNVRFAGAENYIGKKPFSEPETRALRNFTQKIRPDYTVSYHTKGEEIYWYFHQSIRTCSRDEALAKVLSESTGYPLAYAKGSAGGYKDWCIEKLGIPSFTVEAGKDEFTHPLAGEECFLDVVNKNAGALYDLSREYKI